MAFHMHHGSLGQTRQSDKLHMHRLLELPQPEIDDLDRVAWDVPPAEVSKAYRCLSSLVWLIRAELPVLSDFLGLTLKSAAVQLPI